MVAPPGAAAATLPTRAGVAVVEPAVELASPISEEVPLLSIEIRDVAERRLVTLIET